MCLPLTLGLLLLAPVALLVSVVTGLSRSGPLGVLAGAVVVVLSLVGSAVATGRLLRWWRSTKAPVSGA